jgi:predicted phosphodiesterase
MAQIRRHDVDFIVCLGDRVHSWRGFNDPFPTAGAADVGYLDLRAHLGPATAEAAFFAAVGNWDGESGWQPKRLRRLARAARMRYLPNPRPATYPQGGGEHEDYYAWTWGDALFVVLNVASYTPTAHTLSEDDDGTADDWTLGAEQLAWLEATLEASTERFELLFIHHPAGGRGGDEKNSAYGRGGGRAARVGEQARIHQLMLEHGVEVFFYGHDHVFTDMVVDGVHYTLPGSAGAPWKFSAEETGYDDFDERSGYALVHVEPERLSVEFLDLEGEVFRSYQVNPASPAARRRSSSPR